MITPGPWSYIAENGGYTIDSPSQPAGKRDICRIARTKPWDGEDNAKLICAAPDLLAACKAALDALIAAGADGEIWDMPSPVCEQLRDAISKAS